MNFLISPSVLTSWEEGKRSPASKAKLGKKHHKYERKILSFEETARVLTRLEEPYRLIIETAIATGARISEVLGLRWKFVNFETGMIKIEQRVWHQEVGRPKSETSRRESGIGDLVERFRAKADEEGANAEAFVFQQKRAPGRPLWDSGVRDALHQAAAAAGCDFPGLGPLQLCEDQAMLDTLRKGLHAMAREIATKARQERKRLLGGPMVALSRTTEGRRTLSTIRELSAQLIIQRREFGLTPSTATRVEATGGATPMHALERDLCG